jgi:hypothetical protein
MSVMPAFKSFGGKPILPTSARVAARPAILQNQDRVFIDIERGIVNALMIMLDILENDCFSGVLEQVWASSRGLQDRAIRGQITSHHGDAAGAHQRFREWPNHLVVVTFRVLDVFPDGAATHRE